MFSCLNAELSTTPEGVKGRGGISPRMPYIITISGIIVFGPQQLYSLSDNGSLEERVGDVCNEFDFNVIRARIQSTRQNVIHLNIKCSV
jgi:hypothetical protein